MLFAFFVFSAAIALCIFASATLRTHSVWRIEARDQTKALEKEQDQRDELLHGNLLEVVQTKPSIREVTAEVRRVQIDRGRVWRGCLPAQPAADDTVTVSTVAAAPAVGDAAAPAGGAAAAAGAAGAAARRHPRRALWQPIASNRE